jgi:hypothetical protein
MLSVTFIEMMFNDDGNSIAVLTNDFSTTQDEKLIMIDLTGMIYLVRSIPNSNKGYNPRLRNIQIYSGYAFLATQKFNFALGPSVFTI